MPESDELGPSHLVSALKVARANFQRYAAEAEEKAAKDPARASWYSGRASAFAEAGGTIDMALQIRGL